jgi:hypothetical protein
MLAHYRKVLLSEHDSQTVQKEKGKERGKGKEKVEPSKSEQTKEKKKKQTLLEFVLENGRKHKNGVRVCWCSQHYITEY